MRRTDQEFKEEILRRSAAFTARRKKNTKRAMMLCLPLLLCCGGVLAAFSAGIGSAKGTESFSVSAMADMAEPEVAPMEAAPMAPQPMPEDFAIRYSWGMGAMNVYDTYTGTLQKDLVLDGVAEAAFQPGREVLEEIYWKLEELDLASIRRTMTSAELTIDDTMVDMTPLTVYEIQFRKNGAIYTVTGDATATCYQEDEEALRFLEFVEFMNEIVLNTPEYQQMPDRNGAYE